LVTFVAGDADAIETARPVITTYAPRMVVVGERQGQAAVAKLIANFLGASGMDLIGQSLAWAERSGLPPELVPQLLAGFFGNPGTREYIAKIGQRDFDDVGFTAAGGRKDVQLMIDATQAVNLRLSSAEALRTKLDAAIARGWRDRDWSCFTEFDRG
jgi:3-hydroxyisobutyrate dehydrogenase-like beta-hydroxyacid dehydrogenase